MPPQKIKGWAAFWVEALLGTHLCRPSEVVLDILPSEIRPFTKEDSEVTDEAGGGCDSRTAAAASAPVAVLHSSGSVLGVAVGRRGPGS